MTQSATTPVLLGSASVRQNQANIFVKEDTNTGGWKAGAITTAYRRVTVDFDYDDVASPRVFPYNLAGRGSWLIICTFSLVSFPALAEA